MRAHLLDSDVPIIENSTVIANCGEEVPNIRFKFMWDDEFDLSGCSWSAYMENHERPRNMCPKCWKVGFSKRYRSGILNGQELKHGEG